MLPSTIFIKSNLKCRFLHFTITYRRSNHPLYSQSFSSKQKTSASVPKSPLLFNSPSPATAQKPLPSIRHICGLGASVGCERIERTFNTPRLKSQICLIGGNGFVCNFTRVLFFLLASGASVLPAANSYLIIDFSQISVYSCL